MIARSIQIKGFGFLLLALSFSGCGNSTGGEGQMWASGSGPVVIDSEHEQDLMNLSDLQLPDPVDKQSELPIEDKVGTPTSPQPPKTTRPQPQPQTPKGKDPRVALEGRGSVYYVPVVGEKRKCEAKELIHARDLNGQVLVQLCKNEISNCVMQGSCYYPDKKGVKLLAYRKKVEIKDSKSGKVYTEPRFVLNEEHARCPHGMGFRRICLDPYRSVAADMKFHKAGDVFFIPILQGQKLPNGETHDGYVVVRDIGGAITGEGRFDFYIGFDSYVGHLFSKLNLSNPNRSTFSYFKVPEEKAASVRAERGYPLVPQTVNQRALVALARPALGLEAAVVVSQFDISTEFFKSKYEQK